MDKIHKEVSESQDKNGQIDLTKSPVNLNQLGLKPKKKFNWLKAIFLTILFVIIFGSAFYAVRLFVFSQKIGLKITPQDIIEPIKKDPELKKDKTGKYTTVLLVGKDTRNTNKGLQNTDSMIIASYNYDTKNVTMFSVPRDLYVKVPNESWYTKVNALYAIGENRKKGDGLNYLKKALENITGIPIQYYAMIDLQGFRSIVDIMGGLTVTVDNTFTDYCYPADKDSKSVHYCGLLPGMAETVSFTKGEMKMNGALALKFARSRHSSDNGEGSDFYRARRQQNLLVAMQKKILSSDTLLNPKKVLDIIQALQNNLTLSEFTSEDIQAAINIGLSKKDSKSGMYSFVTDPSFGNKQILTTQGFNVGGLYVIGPKAGLDNYKDIHALVSLILAEPEFYADDSVIRIYDTGIGYQKAYQKTLDLQKKYPYSNILFMGTLFKDKTGTVVYSHTANKNTRTVEVFGGLLKADSTDKPSYIKTNLNNEDVTILLGKASTTNSTK